MPLPYSLKSCEDLRNVMQTRTRPGVQPPAFTFTGIAARIAHAQRGFAYAKWDEKIHGSLKFVQDDKIAADVVPEFDWDRFYLSELEGDA